jgi:energy-coupling factor transport system permease protein
MQKRSEFELSLKLSIGQFLPGESSIHRLDPRVKIGMMVALIATSIVASSLAAVMLLLLAVVAGFLTVGVNPGLAFRALKPVLPFLLLLAVIQMFAIPQLREEAIVIWEWKVLKLTDRSLVSAILLIVRFIVIVLGLSLFSFTTSTNQLIHGVEQLLRPLGKIGLPAHELAMIVHISIRFLPILTSETEWLMMAQASRGADFGKGRGFGRLKRLFPLLVPLFIISLRHAGTMAEAMESRCYVGGKNRTYLSRLRLTAVDYKAVCLFFLVMGITFLINYIPETIFLLKTGFPWGMFI